MQSAPRRRRSRTPVPAALLLALVVGSSAATGVIRAANDRTDDIERLPGLSAVVSAESDQFENFLLVGSDTREGVDPDAPDSGGIGDTNDVQGRRSDTIMILRRERNNEGAALLSLPRDLWVEIAGTGRQNRINTAYSHSPERLVQTVTQDLGIPIHHYVEVDFVGFKKLVDEIGGVEVCVDYATKDDNTGLNLQPGCQRLDGVQGLAYARSRHYEEFRDGRWREDPSADLGRIQRQQQFIRSAVDGALQRIGNDPLALGELLGAVTSSVRIDDSIDPVKAADALRQAAETGLATYTLPVRGETIDGNAVLLLDTGADAVLAYFAGTAPAPPPPTTTG